MPRIVMKFGGTSMAGIERIRHVAGLVKREAERGNQLAVVVSAMAGETDRLVHLCKEAAPLYDPREYDVVVASGEQVTAGLLAITLQGMDMNARSYMGWQLPIRASGHSAALIDHIDVDVRFGERSEDRGDGAGAVGQAGQGDPRLVLVVRDARDELLFHVQFLDFVVADDQGSGPVLE